MENLLEVGVLDPAKVTRSGLMNACGIAGIMLTTQVRLLQGVPMATGAHSYMPYSQDCRLTSPAWDSKFLQRRITLPPDVSAAQKSLIREVQGASAVLGRPSWWRRRRTSRQQLLVGVECPEAMAQVACQLA